MSGTMSNVLAGSRSSCAMRPFSVALVWWPVAVVKTLWDGLPVSSRLHPYLPTLDVAPVSTTAEGMDPSITPHLVFLSMLSILGVSRWLSHLLLLGSTRWSYHLSRVGLVLRRSPNHSS